MKALQVFDTVGVPNEFIKGNKHRPGVVTFISECGKYCKIRYSKGNKEFENPYKVSDIPQK